MTAELMRAAIELIMITDYFFLLGGKKKKITKRRTTGSRSEAKNRDVFSKRAQTHSAKAPFERDLVLNEKTYDF